MSSPIPFSSRISRISSVYTMMRSTCPIRSRINSGRSSSAPTCPRACDLFPRLVPESAEAARIPASGVRSTICCMRLPWWRLATQRVQWVTSGPVHNAPSWRRRSTTGQTVQKSVALYTSGAPDSLKAGITLADNPWKCSACMMSGSTSRTYSRARFAIVSFSKSRR